MTRSRTRTCASIFTLALVMPALGQEAGDAGKTARPQTHQDTQPETEVETQPETEVETQPETEVETQPETGIRPQAPDLGTERPRRDPSFHVYWENDGRFFTPINGDDRHYTNGIGIELAFRNQSYEEWEPYLLLPKDFDDPKFAVGFQLRQFIYTPEDLAAAEPILDDQPYAGWLTFGLFAQRADKSKFDHVQLDFGVVGQMAGAQVAQEFVHSILPNQIDPQGWDNQLENEPTFNLRYQRRWRTAKGSLDHVIDGAEYDFIGLAGFNLGNVFIDASVGGIARIGHNIPDDFGPSRLRDFADNTGSHGGDFSIYAFGRLDGRAVARSIFLDGNTFLDSQSVDKHNFVAEASVGVELRYKGFYTSWTQTFFTEAFEGQHGGNYIGQYMVGYRARF